VGYGGCGVTYQPEEVENFFNKILIFRVAISESYVRIVVVESKHNQLKEY